jgi:hypothetical protein
MLLWCFEVALDGLDKPSQNGASQANKAAFAHWMALGELSAPKQPPPL